MAGAARARVPVVRLELVRDSHVAAPTKYVRESRDAAEILRQLIGWADREHLAVVLMDVRLKVLGVHVVAVGTVERVEVTLRDVFKAALLANASAIIVGHNHPSGEPWPSREDLELTNRLLEAGKLLGVRVVDHVIVAGPRHLSIRDNRCVPWVKEW